MFLQVHSSGFPAKFRSYEKYACASKVLNPTFSRQESLGIVDSFPLAPCWPDTALVSHLFLVVGCEGDGTARN